MKKTTLASLCSSCLLLVCSHLHAEESKVDAEAVKWKTYAHIANLLMDADTKDQLMDTGDELKKEDPVEGLVFYLIASKVDPKDPYPSYQAAAALSLMQQEKISERYISEANKKGFWQYPVLATDDEMSFMKDNPVFQELRKVAKERYEAKPDKHVGEYQSYIPQGQQPKNGWPVIVFLHGFGSNKDNSKDMGPVYTKAGYIYLTLNGSEVSGEEGHFQWHDPEWGEKNHSINEQYIDTALNEVAQKTKIDRQSIYISGFSEGAGEAGYLLATYPDHYAGALIISPCNCKKPEKTVAAGKRILIIHGTQESQGNITSSTTFKNLFKSHNTVRTETHPGGHYFQDDYKVSFVDYVDWLSQKKR